MTYRMKLWGLPVASLLLTLGACSQSSDAPETASIMTPDELQTQPLVAGSTQTFALPSAARSLVANSNPTVADVRLSDGGIAVEGKAYGTTLVTLTDARGETYRYSFFVTGQRPELPTEYFAPYNVAPDGISLATSQEPSASGLFTWEDAQQLGRISYQGREYRLPTIDELHALLPYNETIDYLVPGRAVRTSVERVTIGGETRNYQEISYSPGHGLAYAIRLAKAAGENGARDNRYRTAFRYEYQPASEDAQGYGYLRITARYLGENFSGDINTVAQPAFWAKFAWDDHSITLPATGVRSEGMPTEMQGFAGAYWSSSTGADGLSASALILHRGGASHTIHHDRQLQSAVRLIRAN